MCWVHSRVVEDHSLAFRLKAPDAKTVDVDIVGHKYPVTRDADGVWSVVTPPIVVGFHYYALDVDGARMNDLDRLLGRKRKAQASRIRRDVLSCWRKSECNRWISNPTAYRA